VHAQACYELGLAFEAAGRLAAAERELADSVAVWRTAYGDEHHDTRDAVAALARVHATKRASP
jgi:hypothetical protein